MSGKPDPYADIDFEEINEQTNLANDEIKCLDGSLQSKQSKDWLAHRALLLFCYDGGEEGMVVRDDLAWGLC